MIKLRLLRGPNDAPQPDPVLIQIGPRRRCGQYNFRKGDRLFIGETHCEVIGTTPANQVRVRKDWEPLNGGIEVSIGRWKVRSSCVGLLVLPPLPSPIGP